MKLPLESDMNTNPLHPESATAIHDIEKVIVLFASEPV